MLNAGGGGICAVMGGRQRIAGVGAIPDGVACFQGDAPAVKGLKPFKSIGGWSLLILIGLLTTTGILLIRRLSG